MSASWRRPRSLRALFTLIATSLTVLGVIAAGSLMVFTSYSRRAADTLHDSVEGVRLATEAELDLLLYMRAEDSFARANLGSDLLRRLSEVKLFADSDEESGLLATALSDVNAYMEAETSLLPKSPQLESLGDKAFRSLKSLVTINENQASAAQQAAVRMDVLGDVIGAVVIALLAASVPVLILWVRAGFRQMFQISDTLRMFGEGQEAIRLPEQGPEELKEIARTFNRMAEEMARRKESRGTFLAVLAHELRTPLSTLSLAVDRISPERTLPAEEKLRKLLNTMKQQVRRLDLMVSDFFDLAKIESGKLTINRSLNDLRELVSHVGELQRMATPKIALRVSVPERPVVVRCDALRIEQVLMNLLSNAVKYTPPETPIELRLEEKSGQVVACVCDGGPGIPEEEQESLFEPFSRAESGRRIATGTGLGLYISRQIMRAHGGNLTLESARNKGTKFRVVFQLPVLATRALEKAS